MADLVAKMPEQRTVGLVHGGAPLFAFGVVGLFERERDQPVVVTGHHAGSVGMRRARQKVERQAHAAVLVPRIERQIELHQRIKQPMLGDLDLAPGNKIVLDAGIGNGAVMTARRAIFFGRARVDHPIADIEFGIGAKAKGLFVDGERPPHIALGLDRRQCHDLGDEAETMPALFANGVFEIEQLLTMLTFEELHSGPTSRPD